MEPRYFESVLKVRELKEIIKDWPDQRSNGEDTEVWIGTGKYLSSPVVSLMQLNQADMILDSNAFEPENPKEV